MEDSDPTLRGLNRIRTRRVTSEDHSSSGGDDSPAIPKGKSVDDRRGLHKGRKIARWFSSYLNPKDSYKAYNNIPSNAEVQRFNSKMLGKKDEKLKHSLGQKDLTGNQSLPDSSSSRKTSITQKSFSHELGPRGGIRAFNLRACSYSDLKELLGSLHSKFDAVKEAVNAELAGFAGDVRDALEKGSLSKTQDTAEGLLSLSQECIEMTSSHFRDNCESIVYNLAERRRQCQAGLVKQLLTRMLFILTRSTRLLQFQKDGGPINEDCLVSFKQCLESVPPVDTKLGHKIVKTDLSIDFTEKESLSKHPLEDTVFHSEDGIRKSKAHSFGPSGHDEGVLPSKDGDVILHCQKIDNDVPKEAASKSGSDSQFRHDEGVLPSKDGDVLHCQEIETEVPKVVVVSKSSPDSHHEHGESFDGTGSVLCRICEKNIPTSHLESHSYVCAYADKCDLEGLDVDGQLLSIAVVLEQIVESYIQSWHGPSSSPEMSRIQSATSVHGSEGHSPKLQEWHDKGMEGMFEDLHEMDTACIDDPPTAASNNLKNILAMKLGSDHPASSNGSMTPASSSTTPRSSHFDLFWLEHNSPSEPEDVDQMNELADIARRGACTDLSKKGASAYLGMCLNDLLEVLRLSQLEALVIDTFGSRIKDLLEEKYHLAEELMGKRSKTSVQIDGTTENVVIPSQSTTLAPTRLSHKERTSIEDFEIIKPISRGAFGKVFLARKRTTGDLFAIKVLKKLDMIRKNDIERILAERNILITVRNPFVVRFFYSFTCRDNLYLVMEYLNGGDLYSLLGKVGCLEEGGARIYVAELVLALEYLHSLGITHRDLKPDNILIARDGHIKLTDFGLSKIGLIDSAIDLSGPGTACSSLFKSRNQHDVFPEHSQKRGKRSRISAVGTPDYLAPEILLGTAHGYAADWWSVGIILFELITGIPPFSARLPEMIFDNILNRKIPWPRVPNDMSYEAKDLIDRFLNQDQDLRLGANGAAEVKEHPFFKEIDWDNLALQKAVFIPHPDNVDDTSYFISRYSSVSSKAHVDKNSNVYVSDATKSSSNTGTEADMDEYSELKECDSPTSPDLFSINFSFKNLSQLATMNYDALLQSGRTSKCLSPSQGL